MKLLFDELLGEGELSQGSLDLLAPYFEAEIIPDAYSPVIIRPRESYQNFLNNKKDSLITLDEQNVDSVRNFLIYSVLRSKYGDQAAEFIYAIIYVISSGSVVFWKSTNSSFSFLKDLDESLINKIIEDRLELEKSNSNFILRTFLENLNVKP